MNKLNHHFLKKIRILVKKNIIIYGSVEANDELIGILENFSIKICSYTNEKVSLDEILKPDKKDIVIIVMDAFRYEIIERELTKYFNDEVTIMNSGEILSSYYGFKVGKYTYGYNQFLYKGVNIESIGAFCSIADNVNIAMSNHPSEYISTHPFFYRKNFGQLIDNDQLDVLDDPRNQKVIIGNDVWIGVNATILPSVRVGNGAIIGAGAVVTKDVPDYAIVVGVPAKILRYRFSEEDIEHLLRMSWWNWSDEKISSYSHLFRKNSEFIKTFS